MFSKTMIALSHGGRARLPLRDRADARGASAAASMAVGFHGGGFWRPLPRWRLPWWRIFRGGGFHAGHLRARYAREWPRAARRGAFSGLTRYPAYYGYDDGLLRRGATRLRARAATAAAATAAKATPATVPGLRLLRIWA